MNVVGGSLGGRNLQHCSVNVWITIKNSNDACHNCSMLHMSGLYLLEVIAATEALLEPGDCEDKALLMQTVIFIPSAYISFTGAALHTHQAQPSAWWQGPLIQVLYSSYTQRDSLTMLSDDGHAL